MAKAKGETFGVYHKIAIGGFSFTILAAIFLLFGAIWKKGCLVWTWVVIIILVVIIITTVYIIKLCKEWEFTTERTRVYTIFGLIISPCFCLYLVILSVLYALELKKSRSEMEDRIVIYSLWCF
ncbi:uncharacterized protein Dyak_GE28981, isoform B [Drosophila yakuba]|uniref:Uncharacterized protein, isoform B n=1 Tax=Drosophila yakuba TaxID=7245 RepID=A0A0R1DRS5_DROYA|nr:uncharacterized protein Dyak_GE28981, isoform B [Drosophila yakuba]